MTLNRRAVLAGALATTTLPLLSACGGGDSDSPPVAPALKNLVETAQATAQFSTLVSAVVKAELTAALAGTDLLTVFAPTNAAFDAAATALGLADGPALVNALPADALASILLYHVVTGKKLSAGLSAGSLATLYSFDGAPATVTLALSGGVQLTDALLTRSGVITADVNASNGVIHVIDKVLVPPGVLNVVQMAQLNPAFSSLVGAVVSASLVGTLSDASATLTVFAPVDAAFTAIASTVAGLSNTQLGTVLAYHVLGSQVLSSGIPFGTAVNTLAGQSITLNDNAVAPAIATITDTTSTAANIVAVDVRARNGVIHIIDKVLLPNLASPA